MDEKKERKSYTEEQKEKAKELLQEGMKQSEVADLTKIGKSTIIKIAAELKGRKKAVPDESQSPVIASFKAELKAIQERKIEVEALLKDKLKKELEELTEKEESLNRLIDLYSK